MPFVDGAGAAPVKPSNNVFDVFRPNPTLGPMHVGHCARGGAGGSGDARWVLAVLLEYLCPGEMTLFANIGSNDDDCRSRVVKRARFDKKGDFKKEEKSFAAEENSRHIACKL